MRKTQNLSNVKPRKWTQQMFQVHEIRGNPQNSPGKPPWMKHKPLDIKIGKKDK